jgi:hypothetical protein
MRRTEVVVLRLLGLGGWIQQTAGQIGSAVLPHAHPGQAAAAYAYLESALGPAPTKKKTWGLLSSVFESGAWPAPARALARSEAGRGGVSEEALTQLETRLLRRID